MSDAYEAWRRQVDHILLTKWDVSSQDLPDQPWRDWYDDGLTPDEVPGEIALRGDLP